MNPHSHGHSHAAPRSADAGGGQQFNLHTVLVAIRCWWKIAAPVGVLLAVVAGFAVYYFVKPKYTAAAWLSISEKRDFIYRPLPTLAPGKFVQNLVELLRSPPVVEPVASKPAVASTPELARELDPVQALRKKIKIRPIGQSDFYVIEFTSTSPEKAALVANEMAKAFMDLQSLEDARRTERMLVLLKQRLGEQQEAVKNLRGIVEKLTKQVTGQKAFAVKGTNDALPDRNPLAELQSKLNAADIEHALIKAQVQAETELLEKRAIEVPSSVVDEFVEADEHIAGLRARLAHDRAKLKEHERTSTNLMANVAYKQLQKRIAEDESSLEKSRAELQVSIKEDLESQARKSREAQVTAMREKVASSELTMQILQEKFKRELTSLKELHGDALQLEFHRSDYDRASTVHNAIAERILHIEMEQKLPTSVERISDATPPAFPDMRPYKQIVMASLAALFFPFGIAIGVEYLYRRVSSREQVEAAGRIAVVGEITTLPSRGGSRRGRSRKNNRELQLFEESIDGLRTYLSLVDSLQGVKILAVTSAVSREGKTSLAAQLVVSLAGATGKRTLLIDCDMRSPDIHRIFDIERGPGLAEVLGGTCAVEDAIHTEFSDSIHLLPAGTLTTSPHRLLGNGTFNKLLDQLRSTYTYIVIDTPPILPASEALVMARAADAAVLCVRRDFSRLRQVAEAHSRLQTAGVRAAGAVLSGIPTSSYTYRYGSYYYDRHSDEAGTSELVEG